MRISILLPLGALCAAAACEGSGGIESDVGGDFADVVADAADTAGELVADGAEEPGSEVPPACPPLMPEELDLIFAEGADAPMEIVTNETPEGDAFLHQPSVCVDPADPAVPHLLGRMRATLAASAGGVGLAAPQVGVHRRVFLAQRMDRAARPVQAFLNPWIVEYSPETRAAAEGCLSVPGASPVVTRSLWIVIDYDSEDAGPVIGERIGNTVGGAAAYTARIVQHEYDHLQGVLIVD